MYRGCYIVLLSLVLSMLPSRLPFPLRCKKKNGRPVPSIAVVVSKEATVRGWLVIQVGFRRIRVVFPSLIPLHCKEMVAECLALLWGLC